MFLRFGFLIVVVALFLGPATAEYEDPADEFAYRVARSIRPGPLPRPGPRPHPSPTFPRLPRNSHPRYPRDLEAEDRVEVADEAARHPRSIQPYKPHLPRFPSPVRVPGVPAPRHRFKRGGGSVSVDVDKSRGSRTSARVEVQQNLYKSDNGRTRVDTSAYATNRGDRGGMINFSHRFR